MSQSGWYSESALRQLAVRYAAALNEPLDRVVDCLGSLQRAAAASATAAQHSVCNGTSISSISSIHRPTAAPLSASHTTMRTPV